VGGEEKGTHNFEFSGELELAGKPDTGGERVQSWELRAYARSTRICAEGRLRGEVERGSRGLSTQYGK